MKKITPKHILTANLVLWTGLAVINLFRSYALRATGSGAEGFDWVQNVWYNVAFNGSFLILSVPLYYAFEFVKENRWLQRLALLFITISCLALIHVPLYFFFIGLSRPDLVAKEGGMSAFLYSEFVHNYPLMIGYALYYGFVVICLLGVAYYNRYVVEKNENERMRHQLRDAHMQNLKMKLHPHFLFNSLNTVSMMIVNNRKDEAMEFLEELGNLLRTTLTEDHRAFVSLKEEMDFIEQYLGIEQIRFGNRLTVQLHLDSHAEHIQVPHLIIQPLVENAFKHGFSKTLEGSRVSVETMIKDGCVHIHVYNTGPVLPENWILEQNLGHGLGIVKKRLESIYGADATLRVQNHNDKGVMASLRIPVNHND